MAGERGRAATRVLMLSLVFGPDTVSTATMMTQLAYGLREEGFAVSVVTSMPHYNPAPDVLRDPRYRRSLPRLWVESRERGVWVLRAYMRLKGGRVWTRALDFAWFQAITTLACVVRAGRQDVVFVPSPPITLGLSGYVVAKLLRARMIYDVRELWPDVPIRMGMITNPLAIGLITALERFVYRRSTAITSIARSFNEQLARRGVPSRKLHFTPNFVDVARFGAPIERENRFARQHGLDGKFVVLYAGNVGLTQGLDIVIAVAQELRRYPDAVVLVVGDGAGKGQLERAVATAGNPTNLRLLPFQPGDLVPEMYASASVCISPMRFGFSYDTVPSKLYTAMASGRPVVAATEGDTETATLIRESEGGLIVAPESAEGLTMALRRLYTSREEAKRMGENARRWIAEHYSKEAVIARYARVIDSVSAARR